MAGLASVEFVYKVPPPNTGASLVKGYFYGALTPVTVVGKGAKLPAVQHPMIDPRPAVFFGTESVDAGSGSFSPLHFVGGGVDLYCTGGTYSRVRQAAVNIIFTGCTLTQPNGSSGSVEPRIFGVVLSRSIVNGLLVIDADGAIAG